MKRNYALYFSVLMVANGYAKYALEDLQKITHAPAELVRSAMIYLDTLERDFDADWQIYHGILPRMINALGLKVGCEIGVSFGSHCKRILKDTNVERLYGIDPYLNYGDPTNTTMPDVYFDIFHHKVAEKLSIFGNRFHLIRDFSVNAARNFKESFFDFVFLDANHTYAAVMADLNAWYPKVRMGGIMAGDDYATCHPGVPQAVNEFFGKKGMKVFVDREQPRFWWVVKTEGK